MKFIDLLDEYLIARDNFLTFNKSQGIPTKEYNEAGQHLFQTAQQKREALDKALQKVEEIIKYLSEGADGNTGE